MALSRFYFVRFAGAGAFAEAGVDVEAAVGVAAEALFEEVVAGDAAGVSCFTAPYFAASQSRTSAGL